MQYRSKIAAFAVTLATGAIACATLTLILARGIDEGMESVTLAEDQLALYIAMETNVSDLLRLHITAAASPTEATAIRLRETRAAVTRDIEAIREIVGEEVRFRGEEELEELERLDEIEAVLDEIAEAFARIARDAVGPQPLDALAGALDTVVDALDVRLAPLVDLAVADEAGEVLEVRREIAELSRRSVALGTAAGVLTLLCAIVGVYALLSGFMRPFNGVLAGASRLAEGDLSYRIPAGGGGEFARLARDFNTMAARLEASDRALRDEEEELQRRVAARTAELEAANERLGAQDATRRRFLADVSHELRTPLTVMRGEAEVALRARDGRLDAGARDALAGVVEQTEHMSRLVDDLLFVARREAGEVPLSLSRVALGSILESAEHDAARLGGGAVVRLDADAETRAVEVEVDPGRIHQLLMVLLDNAIRYSRAGGGVEIVGRCTPDAVRIIVRDDGIGIPAAEMPEIFDRFVRGSNAVAGGTGLGLPVAKAIAEAHGGALSIDSREGDGTTVTLTLPLRGGGGSR
jgi:signal transduction histidine kinase